MTITYPLSFPATPGIRSSVFRARTAVARSESPFTFTQQIQRHQGQRWEGRVTLPPMTRATAAPWQAVLLALDGGYGTVLFGDPDAKSTLGAGGGTPLVKGASQTGLTLATDGWPNSTAVLKAGDYFQLGTGSSARLHMVVKDATSDGSGEVTLDIWPRLRVSPDDDAALTLASPKGVFRLAGPVSEWSAGPDGLLNIGFDLVEAL